MNNSIRRKSLLLVILLGVISAGFTDPVLHLSPRSAAQIALAASSRTTMQQGTTTDNTITLPLIRKHTPVYPTEASWPMVAANPERTSWAPEGASGFLHVEWHRSFESYIPQNIQIIAALGKIFISTASGLYALDAATGSLVWRYDTELPLGNSPTVFAGVVYVGGFDRKLHALDGLTGVKLWSYDGAKAGYDTNPLVVDNKVILANRDGAVYAIGAHGSSNQGQLVWKFQSGGPIHLSPAYIDGKIFFAANDNYAYALDVSSGSLIWKSAKLPGDGYHSWWPVIFRDKVIFSAADSYRNEADPGTLNFTDSAGNVYGQYYYMERDDIFSEAADGTVLGAQINNPGWGNGFPVINANRITEYLENNPNPLQYKHKPWRRMMIVLNQSNGIEYTFDSDRDGFAEYIPVAKWGTLSGNRYPPIVGPDGILYVSNIYQKFFISQGKVMGWNISSPSHFSLLHGQGAIDETQAISGGGNTIYRNLSGNNAGDWFSIVNREQYGYLWNYYSTLISQAPGFEDQYWHSDGVTMWGNSNGVYGLAGLQNPIIPYQNRLYVLRSNSIIVYGTGPSRGRLPLIPMNDKIDSIATPSVIELRERLEAEVSKIIQAGHLRPGYYNTGQFIFNELEDYFDNPGDTLYTLSLAYPYLSDGLKAQTKAYLMSEFQAYFDPEMYSMTGWANGAPREAMPLPPDLLPALADKLPRPRSGPRFTWEYPPHNFYAMWKYALLVAPENTVRIYDLAKSKIQVPVPALATNQHLAEETWEHNAYIAGYLGFLELQRLAGKDVVDSELRQAVTNEMNRLFQLRILNFDVNSPWADDTTHKWHLNIARNFMFLVPELGSFMRAHLYNQVEDALSEYSDIAPYWFASRYENVPDEGIMSALYNYNALFQAKAYILEENRGQLTKYLDVPAFERGDLFYILNLIAAIEAADN